MYNLNIRTAYTFDDILLTPQVSKVLSREDCSLESTLVGDIRLRVPFLSANMHTLTEHRMMTAVAEFGGLGVLHRYLNVQDGLTQLSLHLTERACPEDYPVAYAVGVGEFARLEAYENGLDAIRQRMGKSLPSIAVLDVAHGAGIAALRTLERMRLERRVKYIIAGNVATGKTYVELVACGADAVKVGIGAGSICSTRTVTGCGVPQLAALMDVAESQDRLGLPVPYIADGGIRSSGDIVKCFWAGASSVMLGSLLSGTDETPGVVTDGTKRYDGMASIHFSGKRRTAEGVQSEVAVKGPVKDVLQDLVGGVQSGLSYVGLSSLEQLHTAQARLISQSGLAENQTHINGSVRKMTKF